MPAIVTTTKPCDAGRRAARQSELRNAAWWLVLWTDRIVELSPHAPITVPGGAAIDAGASRCTVMHWVLNWPIFKEIPHWEWPMWQDKLQPIAVPFERFVADGILRRLMTEVGPHSPGVHFPAKALPDERLSHVMSAGVTAGLAAMARQLQDETRWAASLADVGFAAAAMKDPNERARAG